jgi:hypothetical protein
MFIQKRSGIAGACIAVALGAAGCGKTAEAEGPAGGYDAQGYPLDKNGHVSRNPQDYRQSICETQMFEDDPEC